MLIIEKKISYFLSVHADNRKKDILVLGEGTTDGLDITAATLKDKYSVNITTSRKKICLKNVYATMPQTIFYMV